MATSARPEPDLSALLLQLKEELGLLRETVGYNCESGFMFNLERLNASHREAVTAVQALAAQVQEAAGQRKRAADQLDRITEQLALLEQRWSGDPHASDPAELLRHIREEVEGAV